jgi:CRISPR-associated endonuclease/helicase Cas3
VATVGTFLKRTDFVAAFEALTDHKPYYWQECLFHEFLAGCFPQNINLPTGAGKTSIIPIWLLALAEQSRVEGRPTTIPRRLVWIVDRRVVVDQATEEAQNLRKALNTSKPELELLQKSLRNIALNLENQEPLAISTLRGEREDNREWSMDPSRPAVIVGTVDMIGSRLLFSGYGDSRYWRAQHAGLLGHDSLIVNDEAHLTRALGQLLCSVETHQTAMLKPFRTIRLSATHPESECWPKSLDRDQQHPHFKKTFEATKRLFIQTHPAVSLESAILNTATIPKAGRTVVFVRKPETVRKIAEGIRKRLATTDMADRVLTLTGTMRGFERDQLANKEIFKVFSSPVRPTQDYWLVATSAGEVGINISADQLITDLDTVDHLLQRFGRLNRFGETKGIAHLIANEKPKEERHTATLAFLREKLEGNEEDGYDISPRALFGMHLDENACSERSLLAPLRPWHIDVWSQTSLGLHPSRPMVEPWLRGQQKNAAETYLCWREDVADLIAWGVADDQREEVLEKYRVLAHEQLQLPTYRLLEDLRMLFSRAERKATVLRIKPDGTVSTLNLPIIRNGANVRNEDDTGAVIKELAYCRLIFPPGLGTLEDGMFISNWSLTGPDLESEAEPQSLEGYDVSGAQQREDKNGVRSETRASFRVTLNGDLVAGIQRLGKIPHSEYSTVVRGNLEKLERGDLERFAAENGWKFLFKVEPDRDSEEDKRVALLYFGPINFQQKSPTEVLSIKKHCEHVRDLTVSLAQRLGLDLQVVEALKNAGELHDLGKCVPIWQKAAGNPWDNATQQFKHEAIAKPIGNMRGRQLGGFRHELSSLQRASERLQSASLTEAVIELAQHLIASHHGHARPCFESKAYDRTQLTDSAKVAHQSTLRFAALQKKYGAWGLAYLESILRAADGLASQGYREQPSDA